MQVFWLVGLGYTVRIWWVLIGASWHYVVLNQNISLGNILEKFILSFRKLVNQIYAFIKVKITASKKSQRRWGGVNRRKAMPLDNEILFEELHCLWLQRAAWLRMFTVDKTLTLLLPVTLFSFKKNYKMYLRNFPSFAPYFWKVSLKFGSCFLSFCFHCHSAWECVCVSITTPLSPLGGTQLFGKATDLPMDMRFRAKSLTS